MKRTKLLLTFGCPLDKIAYSVLRVNGSFSRPGLSIIVKGVDGVARPG